MVNPWANLHHAVAMPSVSVFEGGRQERLRLGPGCSLYVPDWVQGQRRLVQLYMAWMDPMCLNIPHYFDPQTSRFPQLPSRENRYYQT
jgi:hypothetical protein